MWIDEAGIRAGHKWRNEIADGIQVGRGRKVEERENVAVCTMLVLPRTNFHHHYYNSIM